MAEVVQAGSYVLFSWFTCAGFTCAEVVNLRYCLAGLQYKLVLVRWIACLVEMVHCREQVRPTTSLASSFSSVDMYGPVLSLSMTAVSTTLSLTA